jgi:hypothetical protein
MTLLRRLVSLVANESAVFMYGLNALVTAWVAFGFRASPAQTAAVTTIGAALVTIVTAFAARPVSVPVITGAVSTVAVASAAFGLHLSAAQIGAGVPVLALVLSLVLRQAVTPLVTLRQSAHEPEHAAPAVHPAAVHLRMAEEDLEALGDRLAAKVATAVRPARTSRPPRTATK